MTQRSLQPFHLHAPNVNPFWRVVPEDPDVRCYPPSISRVVSDGVVLQAFPPKMSTRHRSSQVLKVIRANTPPNSRLDRKTPAKNKNMSGKMPQGNTSKRLLGGGLWVRSS